MADLLDSMPDEFLECREQHAWVKAGTAWDARLKCYTRVRYCPRCEGTRKQRIAADGSLIGHAFYEYPDGYLIKGIGRIGSDGRDQMRLYNIRREIAEAQAEAAEANALSARRKK